MSTSFNLRPSNIYPHWDFWFENKPSGNPATHIYTDLTDPYKGEELASKGFMALRF
jgi:hypothetical protein